MRIPGCQKSGEDGVYPVTPDFVDFLRAIPKSDQTGFVFQPLGNDGLPVNKDWIGSRVRAIGKAAGIMVCKRKKSFAGIHDLRRSFAFRWARKVKPPVLQELMRHEDLRTTTAYYAVGEIKETTKFLREEFGRS